MEIHQIGVMDTLIREFTCVSSLNGFKIDPKSINLAIESNSEYPNSDPESSPNTDTSAGSPGSGSNSGFDSPDDPTDAGLKYINQMLNEEEDLEHQPCMFQDCIAFQAAEKSFYDVIGQKYPHPLCSGQDFDSPISNFTSSNNSSDSPVEPDWFNGVDKRETPIVTPNDSQKEDFDISQFLRLDDSEDLDKGLHEHGMKERDHSPSGSGGKRTHYVDDDEFIGNGRSNKQVASNYVEESDEQSAAMYDRVLLCPNLNPHLHELKDDFCLNNASIVQVKKSSGGRPRKKQGERKEVIDLSTLLTQCAQAVASNDVRTANDLLKRIRHHSSPHGDGSERLAHFLANALERRLVGDGTGTLVSNRISAREVLKGYQVYIQACPFKKLANLYANRKIYKLSKKSRSLHIIDFGILYGFQWPCLIQLLSMAENGPPKLRITGIELPHSGLRPAERIEETGRRLKNYCERFNVPFEYTAIAKKWDNVQLEDIKFDKDEILVVNCLYRLRNVPDDTVVASNPRDTVLNLIRKINPDLFVHGVVNGTYNAPFFLTRFRETFFHFSALFDMFDSTVNREDQNRMLYEREVFGKDAMNVIACEGTERVERPETYKQWQVRNLRAGFRQAALDKEIVAEVRERVRRGYHKDFVVDEDGKWMLQGWKGRIICGVSCWKPARE